MFRKLVCTLGFAPTFIAYPEIITAEPPCPKSEATVATKQEEANSGPVSLRPATRRTTITTTETFSEIEIDSPHKPQLPQTVRIKVGVPDNEIEVRFGDERRQFYTEWQFDAEKDRLFCYYYFRPDSLLAVYKKQLVVHYHHSPLHSNGYTCFYNLEKGTYWGRCTTKHHPLHNPAVMKWHFMKDMKWDNKLVPGAPLIPGSKDGVGMINPPDPPL